MIGDNINYLRKKNKISQQQLADEMGVPRTTMGDYEREKSEPNIAMLIKIAKYFDVKVDQLIKDNLSHRDYEILKNKHMKVLAITVDQEQKGNIELVDTKAEAGYLESFQDPEYIRDLPRISFPNIPQGSFRGFEINGDSMLPIEPGSIIISSYVEQIAELKDDSTYIIISEESGVVYKRIKRDDANQQLILISDNEVYLPYTIDYSEISEIWKYYAHLSFSDRKQIFHDAMEGQLSAIHQRLGKIEQKLK